MGVFGEWDFVSECKKLGYEQIEIKHTDIGTEIIGRPRIPLPRRMMQPALWDVCSELYRHLLFSEKIDDECDFLKEYKTEDKFTFLKVIVLMEGIF